jgi:Phosphate transport (Pho88)
MGIAMMGVMHLYLKFTQPLFVQMIMSLKALYEAKPVWIHVLGKSAQGDLKRPFQTPGMFGGTSGFFLYSFTHLPNCPIISLPFASAKSFRSDILCHLTQHCHFVLLSPPSFQWPANRRCLHR